MAGKLPPYMIPAAIIKLDQLPLTVNGKLDIHALPTADNRLDQHYRAPGDAIEEILAGIYAQVLGRDRVSVDDSFFDLGGDSILSMQVVAQARAAGLTCRPRDIFVEQTVARLARTVTVAQPPTGPADEGLGDFTPTPIMAWLNALDGPTNQFSQTVIVQAPAEATAEDAITVLQALLDHHPMLRLSLAPDATRITIPEPGTVRARTCLYTVDELSAAAITSARAELDPTTGTVVRAVWAAVTGEMAMIVHHLAIDAVSWHILLEDLNTAWTQHRRRSPIALPHPPTSFATWAAHLAQHAISPTTTQHAQAWRDVLVTPPALAAPHPHTDTYATAATLTATLDTDTTQHLLNNVPAAFHTGITDILLIAYALACTELFNTTTVGIDVETHGRHDDLFPDTDLTRTVGWFTSKHPVTITLDRLPWDDVITGATRLGGIVKQAKEQLRALPPALTYGLLRYLNPQTTISEAEPTLAFNYLGHIPAPITGLPDDLWGLSPTHTTLTEAAAASPTPLAHSLLLNAATVTTTTGPQLHTTWTWAPSALDRCRIRRLAHLFTQALQGLTAHVLHGGGGLTPSDITPALLTQHQIDALTHDHDASDILPLTPLQQGLLFHTRTATTTDDVYVMQVELTVKGALEPDRLRDAVDAVARRHPNLAARFRSEFDQPVQLIPADPTVPYQYVDLADISTNSVEPTKIRFSARIAGPARPNAPTQTMTAEPCAAEDRIRQLCAAERGAVGDPAHGPSFRVAAIRTAPDEHRVVLTNHHIVLDGWSMPILARDLFAHYYGHNLPPAASYRRFIEWLVDRDDAAALVAWREVLADLDTPTLVGPPERVGLGPRGTSSITVATETTEALAELARACHTTISTVLHAAWAQTLMWLTGQHDVVFGTAVSGRPTDIPEAESMVGLLINTVPVRARVTADTTIASLLEQLHDAHQRTLDHQHLALAKIQHVSGHRQLFDTIFVYENYPLDAAALFAGQLAVTEVKTREFNHYPLAMIAQPGDELGLRIEFDTGVYDSERIEALEKRFKRILVAMTAAPGQS
ncbi:hypothetical protein MDUV_05870 [Mycolicibacterium duvalii]|uniref:Carrier domain-containing protein n=1 Tax=Mycolicibacterium duvalii TaxID=39688 RepID=A0A7I7JV25_9MYCO|nr:hypothetical protein MDUV_05870 [Mycolicibacterium duvalii]